MTTINHRPTIADCPSWCRNVELDEFGVITHGNDHFAFAAESFAGTEGAALLAVPAAARGPALDGDHDRRRHGDGHRAAALSGALSWLPRCSGPPTSRKSTSSPPNAEQRPRPRRSGALSLSSTVYLDERRAGLQHCGAELTLEECGHPSGRVARRSVRNILGQ